MFKTITSFLVVMPISILALANSLNPTYPPPYEAYTAIANQTANGWVIDVQVQPGFYLYVKDFQPQVNDQQSSTLLSWTQPTLDTVQDPLRGSVQVMRHEFQTQLTVEQSGELWLALQGCADSGFCYPPEKRLLAIISD